MYEPLLCVLSRSTQTVSKGQLLTVEMDEVAHLMAAKDLVTLVPTTPANTKDAAGEEEDDEFHDEGSLNGISPLSIC